jgi:MoxR-like ATPase
MSNSPEDAARRWLARFVDLYAGMDSDSPDDPIHAARRAAKRALADGPTAEDPYRVAEMAAAALPDDPRAAALVEEWHAERLRAQDDHGDASGPIAG